jgi:choline dehydrogenase-like flavoprotein
MIAERYFLEIPIYRVSRDAFHAQFNRDQNAHLERQRVLGGVQPGQLPDWEMGVRDRFWAAYGTPWQYNQVVGWLRLFRLGTQLRGDLWLVHAKRYARTMAHKHYRLVGKAFEMWLSSDDSDADIVAQLRGEFAEIERAYKTRNLVLDLECFNNIAPHVRWNDLMLAPPVEPLSPAI